MSLLLLLRGGGAPPAAPPAAPVHSQVLVGPYDLISDPFVRLAKAGYDRGAAEPSVTELISRFLDGSRVVGAGAANRTLRLPVWVFGTGTARAARLNALLRLVNSEAWSFVIIPSGGLPVVVDCFRGRAPLVSDLDAELQGAQAVEITAPAMPYVRSLNPVTIPLQGTSTVISHLDSTPARLVNCLQMLVGTPDGTARQLLLFPADNSNPSAPRRAVSTLTVGDTLPRPISLPTVRSVSLTVQPQNARILSATLLLTTALGHSWNSNADLSQAGNGGAPGLITFPETPIPELITDWDLTFTLLGNGADVPDLSISDLIAYPASSLAQLTQYGGSFTVADMPGSARTPINLTLTPQAAGGAVKTWLVHRPPADQPKAAPIIPLLPTGAAGTASGTAAAGARYSGSWTVYLGLVSTSAPASVPGRTFTALFSQTPGGFSSQLSVSPPSVTWPGLIRVGVIDLPLVGQPRDGVSTFRVTVTSTQPLDVIDAVLLVSTEGETILCQAPTGQTQIFIDEPDASAQDPGIYGTTAQPPTRGSATSLAGSCLPATVPLSLDPGRNTLLVYSPDRPLAAALTAYPRWMHEADR